ncbi:MAG TPA: GNAT family N-acetyltransferase [Nocardioidaceae bacterium]|nr:GNAT family N-acetyltransferase [Nocardioidaceae bacterium]
MGREPQRWREDAVDAQEVVEHVRPGARVFLGSACATPRALVTALGAKHDLIGGGVEVVHFLTDGALHAPTYRHRTWYVGQDLRHLAEQGGLDYVPMSLADVPARFANGSEAIDIAVVSIGPPDAEGRCSLGVSVDVTLAAVHAAKMVLAQVMPAMPTVRGSGFVDWDLVTAHTVVDDEPIEYVHPPVGEVAEQVARYVARLVPDGSTLQVGLGRVPNEMLRHLTNRRRLGIHSDVLTEPLVELVESGAVDGSEKSVDPGVVVGSWAMGTGRLYKLLDGNPSFQLRGADEVCAPAVLAAQERLVSVTQGFAIDLTGQVTIDSHEGGVYGGVSTQTDFHRAAANSPGGRAIVCISSVRDDGTSAIQLHLAPEQAVGIARHEVRWVVTEWGGAYLYGLSLRERAVALIDLAHPDHQDALLELARAARLLPPGQELRKHQAYPDHEVRVVELRDGRSVTVRPSRTSDAAMLRRLFHRLPPQDVFTRFFQQLKSLSTTMAEQLCSASYDNEMSFVAVVGDAENEQVIATAQYFLLPETGLADVGYMVDPGYAGCGLGSAMQDLLVDYARRQGIRGFHADVLTKNIAMLGVLEKADAETTVGREEYGSVEVQQIFR